MCVCGCLFVTLYKRKLRCLFADLKSFGKNTFLANVWESLGEMAFLAIVWQSLGETAFLAKDWESLGETAFLAKVWESLGKSIFGTSLGILSVLVVFLVGILLVECRSRMYLW